MASLTWDGRNARVQFIFNGRRHALRLGAVPKGVAETVRQRLGELADARRYGAEPGPAVLRWLAALDDEVHAKLAGFGLVGPRRRMTFADFAMEYHATRPDVCALSKRNYRQAAQMIARFFGGAGVHEITADDVARWRDALVDEGYARATVGRTIKFARQFFKAAIDRGLAASNPFLSVKAWDVSNPDRQRFIDRPTFARLMAATDNPRWHAILTLSRIGGIRCPSETLALEWSDIDWERGRFVVRAHKTRTRVVPLFPELRATLSVMPRRSARVVDGVPTTHFRGRMMRLIERAGLEPWPRLFHNLRASRQTELEAEYPTHVVCAWLGNSPAVAARHYLQVTEADFARAAQQAAQPRSA